MTLAAKTLGAVKSNYMGTIVRVAAQFGAQVVIMRALGPELVGTFGYALLLFGVLALLIDQGFGWSLQQGDFADAELAVVLSRLMLASALGMLLVYGLSYPLADYLDSPLAGQVFRYSAPSYLLIAVYGISHARLRSELRFREIQYATTGAYVVAYPLVGVGMALAGFGVWALLAAWYVQSILQLAIGYYYSPHSLAFGNPFRKAQAAALGRQVAGINVLKWLVDNCSGAFAGAMGAQSLGNFNAANMLARTPALQLATTLQSILFSTASALAKDIARVRKLYLGALASIAFVVVPAYAYASTHADLLIGLLFGDKWLNAAGIFAAMATGMVAMALSSLSGAILTATGGQRAEMRSQLVCLVLMLLGLYFAFDHGLVYVGLVISAAYLVRLLIQMRAIGGRAEVPAREFMVALRGPLTMGLVFAFSVSPWLTYGAHPLLYEGLEISAKVGLAVSLCKIFPHYFLCPAVADVMGRFGAGRRLLRGLGR